MMTSIITFLLGCFFTWFVTHLYSVNITMPKLNIGGTGGGTSPFGPGFRIGRISVKNELSQLGLRIPTTIILGKPIKTYFGNQVVERKIASRCTASLLDENHKNISQLWWESGKEVISSVDIKSGEQANLVAFVREENDSENYYPYQPVSQSDTTPKIIHVPKFNKTMNFLVVISYSWNQSIEIPVRVSIDYNGNFYLESKNSSSNF